MVSRPDWLSCVGGLNIRAAVARLMREYRISRTVDSENMDRSI
jgi:hypothetical protein